MMNHDNTISRSGRGFGSRPAPTAVLVSGGGPVGLVTAIALARSGQDVTHVAPRAAPPDDGRTIALLAASWKLLADLGVAREALPDVAPLRTMRIVDATGSLFRTPPVEFRAAEVGLEAFGWNIPLPGLVKALEAIAAATPGLTRLDDKVASADCGPDAVSMELTSGGRCEARLAVAADGKDSLLREAAGIATRRWAYPQVAVTARLEHTRPHREVSTEFHTRGGPCTLVPMPGQVSALVWMMAPERAERLSALPPEAFARRVEDETQSIVGQLTLIGKRAVIPMGGLSVETLAARRVALVGESGHLFPPIGAQGLNMGLRDVRALVDAVQGATDPGADQVLQRYAKARAMDVAGRTAAVDLANRSLLAPFLPIDLLRGIGLVGMAHIGPLRRLVMRSGLAGGVARAG